MMRKVFVVLIVMSFALPYVHAQIVVSDTLLSNDTLVVDSIAQVDSISISDSSYAEIDSLEIRYGVKLYDTLPALAEAVMEALRTRKFQDIVPFIATSEMIKVEFDTFDLQYLNRLAGVKYQYMYNQLRKQHAKMVAIGKRNHLNIKMMEIVRHRYRQRIHEGHEYGEVTYLCEYGRHKFYITFVAIKLIDRWFLADDLKIEELIEPTESRRR